MPPTLLDADEETDRSAFSAYLRAQSDSDLMDITRHLDPECYPARCDAARQEIGHRGLLQTPAFTDRESAMRYLSLTALALAAITLALTCMLTTADAAGPSWPTGDMLPDGLPVSEAAHLFTVALLRGLVVWCAHLGIYPLLLLALAAWIARQAAPVFRHRARADVWRLALLGFSILLATVLIAAGPQTAVPALFGLRPDAPLRQNIQPLLNPFYSADPHADRPY